MEQCAVIRPDKVVSKWHLFSTKLHQTHLYMLARSITEFLKSHTLTALPFSLQIKIKYFWLYMSAMMQLFNTYHAISKFSRRQADNIVLIFPRK